MKQGTRSPRWVKAAALVASVLSASCGTGAVQAQAGQPEPHSAPPSHPAAHADPDVRFMTGMIAHHAQALDMVALVPERATRADVRRMAERIEVSQRDEIAMMQRWLQARGHPVPAADAAHAHHGPAHARMPGMLSEEEMQRLAAARGPEFDRLFLELMIRHHEGALEMVAELFGTPGGGQASEVFHVASEVGADQRMEIERMRTMLAGPLDGSRPR
ncbi:MAG: DUF305 domain-containing protein [Gemmatimonadetes bacterium]|nr:DUF305 domain-containing protein [Gemmatimonadota bacterium]